MIRKSGVVKVHSSFVDFLAEDFRRLPPDVIERCRRIDGHRLFLSGATGFFGKNLLALLQFLRLQGASFEVTALSRSPAVFLTQQSWCRNFDWLHFCKGDAREEWSADGNYSLVLHAATDTIASAHVDKLDMFEDIVSGVRQALSFATRHRVERVLLCGSGAQYGVIPRAFAAGIPETSSSACDPGKVTSAYGEAKRVSELLGALHGEKHGFKVVNTRCFAFVGPGLALDGHFAIGNFLRDALAGRPIRLSSAGTALRSYLYGADLAAWLLVLLLEAPHGTTINVGSNQAASVLDVASRVSSLVSPGLSVIVGPAIPDIERSVYIPAVAAAREFGLDIWTDLDLSIRRTASWYRP